MPICVAVALSLAAIPTRTPRLAFDENYYFPLAEKITQGTYQDGYVIRPPLYPLLLAAIIATVGRTFTPLLVVHSIIRGITVGLTCLVGRKFFGKTAGFVAGLLVAIYPLHIYTYNRFLTEVIYIPLFLVSIIAIDNALMSEKPAKFVAAGIASGVASLARSTSFFLTLLLAAWMALRRSDGKRLSLRCLKNASIMLLAMFVVISPWTVRNAITHKCLILLDNATPFNLWLITSGKDIDELSKEWSAFPTHAQRQREAYRNWLANLRRDPLFHLRRIPKVLLKIYDPKNDPSINGLSTKFDGYQAKTNAHLQKVLEAAVPIWIGIVSAGGIVGLLLLEKQSRRKHLLLIVIVYFILLHGATLARPRFMLPINNLLATYSGALISWALSRLGLTKQDRPYES